MRYAQYTVLSLAALLITAVTGVAQTNSLFLLIVQNNFAQWDLNHDGILSPAELDTAVANPLTTDKNAAAVAALKRASRLATNSLPPLTQETIAALTAHHQPDLEQMYSDAWKRISSATNRTLFANGQPKLETIHQGKLGNCFCLAPLGAMVNRDPSQVAGMFAAETNGNYSVRLGKNWLKSRRLPMRKLRCRRPMNMMASG